MTAISGAPIIAAHARLKICAHVRLKQHLNDDRFAQHPNYPQN
jgi:hypothetical protein